MGRWKLELELLTCPGFLDFTYAFLVIIVLCDRIVFIFVDKVATVKVG